MRDEVQLAASSTYNSYHFSQYHVDSFNNQHILPSGSGFSNSSGRPRPWGDKKGWLIVNNFKDNPFEKIKQFIKPSNRKRITSLLPEDESDECVDSSTSSDENSSRNEEMNMNIPNDNSDQYQTTTVSEDQLSTDDSMGLANLYNKANLPRPRSPTDGMIRCILQPPHYSRIQQWINDGTSFINQIPHSSPENVEGSSANAIQDETPNEPMRKKMKIAPPSAIETTEQPTLCLGLDRTDVPVYDQNLKIPPDIRLYSYFSDETKKNALEESISDENSSDNPPEAEPIETPTEQPALCLELDRSAVPVNDENLKIPPDIRSYSYFSDETKKNAFLEESISNPKFSDNPPETEQSTAIETPRKVEQESNFDSSEELEFSEDEFERLPDSYSRFIPQYPNVNSNRGVNESSIREPEEAEDYFDETYVDMEDMTE